MREPPYIVGVDVANPAEPRQGIFVWREGVRFLHALPVKAAVVAYEGQIIVVPPNGPPYTVDPWTGQTTPLDLKD